MRFGSVFACAVVAPLLIAASQPMRLQPSSQWVVDYAENSCRLIRVFGEGDSKIVLMLESDSPDDVDMLLYGKPLQSSREEVTGTFLPVQGEPLKGRVLKTDKGQPAILFSTVHFLPPLDMAKVHAEEERLKVTPRTRPPAVDLGERRARQDDRETFASAANELKIDARRERPVILETGPLGQAIKAFDKCSRDSLKDWGVNPEIEEKVVRPVWVENPVGLFSGDDYPKKMLDQGQQSDVKARVLVDASGRVTKCTSLSHFNLPEFNQLVCDRITRLARFEPAELADGTKVPSFYTMRINFRIAP